MRIGLVPRLLPGGRATGTDDPLLESLGVGEAVNRAVLSGLLVAEPLRERSREGDPITILLLSFGAPDQCARPASACCEGPDRRPAATPAPGRAKGLGGGTVDRRRRPLGDLARDLWAMTGTVGR